MVFSNTNSQSKALDCLIAIQNNNLGLSLAYTLNAQYIPRIDIADKRSIPLTQNHILSSINPNLRTPLLRHWEVDIYMSALGLLNRIRTDRPLEAFINWYDASGHDEIRVDGYRVWEDGLGCFLLCGCSALSAYEWREDGKEGDPLGVF